MNASAYNPGTTGGRREDLRNVLTILEPEATPFTSLVRKGTAPKSTFIETMADSLRAAKTAGSKEGTDAQKGGNKAVNRVRFGVYIHRAMETFGVSDVQEIISRNGGQAGVDDEYANSKAKTIREMKRDIEAVNMGVQDHTGGADTTDMTTRGAMSWIDTTAQASNPVPASFRPVSAAILSGVGTTVPLFTENQLNDMLKGLKGVYGGKRTYQMIGGNNIADTIDHFTRVNSSTTNARYNVMQDADENEITMMVSVFESSFGRLEVQTDDFVAVSAAGVGDANQGGIFNMDLWHMDQFDPLHTMDLPDLGGGPTGFAKVMWALLCDSPRGNGRIYNT